MFMNKNRTRGTLNNKVRTNKETQFRKHRNQMTLEEIKKCASLIRGIKKISANRSRHILKKQGHDFDNKVLYDTLNAKGLENNIIEYNEIYVNNRWQQRVLLRCNKEIEMLNSKTNRIELVNACVVLDITVNEIITVYFNRVGDNHSGLDMSNYCKDLIIRDYKSGGHGLSNRGLPSQIRQRFDGF